MMFPATTSCCVPRRRQGSVCLMASGSIITAAASCEPLHRTESKKHPRQNSRPGFPDNTGLSQYAKHWAKSFICIMSGVLAATHMVTTGPLPHSHCPGGSRPQPAWGMAAVVGKSKSRLRRPLHEDPATEGWTFKVTHPLHLPRDLSDPGQRSSGHPRI
nr:uncharacterized protein LOC112429480 [Macaca nemestrina]